MTQKGRKNSLGPDTGTLETVAVGCTTLATLLTIGLADKLESSEIGELNLMPLSLTTG